MTLGEELKEISKDKAKVVNWFYDMLKTLKPAMVENAKMGRKYYVLTPDWSAKAYDNYVDSSKEVIDFFHNEDLHIGFDGRDECVISW